jgi:hypothetical protein
MAEVSSTNPVDHRAENVSYRGHHEELPDGMPSRPDQPGNIGSFLRPSQGKTGRVNPPTTWWKSFLNRYSFRGSQPM